MNEQVSWKDQSFTLLVFGGIVFLCSIFFVLGMLVGRGQGQRAAEAAVVSAAAKTAAAEARTQAEKASLSTYESIETGKETKAGTAPPPAPVKPATPAPAPAAAATVAPAKAAPKPPAPPPPAAKVPTPAKMIYLQVTALEKNSAANKQVEELRKSGFPAVVMGGDGPNALYKVQVGPFATAADAEIAKRKLEALGYKPIRK